MQTDVPPLATGRAHFSDINKYLGTTGTNRCRPLNRPQALTARPLCVKEFRSFTLKGTQMSGASCRPRCLPVEGLPRWEEDPSTPEGLYIPKREGGAEGAREEMDIWVLSLSHARNYVSDEKCRFFFIY